MRYVQVPAAAGDACARGTERLTPRWLNPVTDRLCRAARWVRADGWVLILSACRIAWTRRMTASRAQSLSRPHSALVCELEAPCLSFRNYGSCATSDAAAYHMVNAGERIRSALADQGYAPR